MPPRVFLSYQHEDRGDVAQLARALREAGMRPWQDVDNLTAGTPTRDEIRRVIEDDCCGAIVWLSARALASDFVTRVEIPELLGRAEGGGFTLMPVFVGLPPEQGNSLLLQQQGVEVSPYSGHVLDVASEVASQARVIAKRFIEARLRSVAKATSDRPTIRMVSRADTAGSIDSSWLDFDWRHVFVTGPSPADSGRKVPVEALLRSIDTLLGAVPPGAVRLDARCHLSIAVAMGYALRQPTGAVPEIAVGEEWWAASMEQLGTALPLNLSRAPGSDTGGHLSVELSLTQDVENGVRATIAAENLRYACRLKFRPPDGPFRDSVADGAAANKMAEQVVREVLETRGEFGATQLDLYLACPLPVATFIGWRLNAVGRVRLFEWDPTEGRYSPGLSLP